MTEQGSRTAQATERQLVLRTLLGDMAAFDALVRRYRSAVIAVAEQVLGTRCRAEDVAQDAFLLAFKALPTLHDPTRFGPWLCAITRRRAYRVAAQEGHVEATEPSRLDRLILTHSDMLTPDPAAEFLRQEEFAVVEEMLSELSRDYQMVLRLRYWEEWPVARIADFLSLPVTTVKWRLHSGREALRRRLTTDLKGHTDE